MKKDSNDYWDLDTRTGRALLEDEFVGCDDQTHQLGGVIAHSQTHVGWLLILTWDGESIHTSEHHSLRDAKRAAAKAIGRCLELRGVP